MYEVPQGPDPDEFERKLRELTDEVGGQARFKEPSAAERAAAAKRKTRRARLRGVRLRLWTTVAVVAVAAAAIGWLRFGTASSNARNDTQAVRSGPTVRLPPAPPPGPPANPFTGSPAAGYADGTAGIVTPAARPAGAFTAAQVSAAYTETRKLLIAADLDWPTLQGAAPDTFASLLIPQQRTLFSRGLDKIGLDKKGYALSTRQWVASFAPGSTQFVTRTVKVHGVMSAASATDSSGQRVLRVRVNYLFVYAVEPPSEPAGWMRIVAQAYGNVEFAPWNDPGGSVEPWVLFTDGYAGVHCGIADGFVHPGFRYTAPDKVQPSGPPVDPYALNTPPPGNSCERATRT